MLHGLAIHLPQSCTVHNSLIGSISIISIQLACTIADSHLYIHTKASLLWCVYYKAKILEQNTYSRTMQLLQTAKHLDHESLHQLENPT